MGAVAGSSMIFFMLLILQVVLACAVLAYAAHSFLTIVVDTAAGNDHVVWPAEPFTDWLWKPFYLGWVVAVWLTPLALILTLAKFRPLQVWLISLGFFWLVVPFGLLSSLSASTRFLIFRPLILLCMLRHFGTTIVFYVATEFLLAAWAATFVLTLGFSDSALLLVFPALASAVTLFLYGRLLGRLAWVIQQRNLGKQEELEAVADAAEVQDPWSGAGTATAQPSQDKEEEPYWKPKAKAVDPWAVPSKEDDPDFYKKGLPLDVQKAGGYGLLTEEPSAVPPPKPARGKRRPEAVYAAEPVRPVKRELESIVPEVPKKERELVERTVETPPPAFPMFTGVYSFLAYPATIGPLLTVALGLWLMGLVLRTQFSFMKF